MIDEKKVTYKNFRFSEKIDEIKKRLVIKLKKNFKTFDKPSVEIPTTSKVLNQFGYEMKTTHTYYSAELFDATSYPFKFGFDGGEEDFTNPSSFEPLYLVANKKKMLKISQKSYENADKYLDAIIANLLLVNVYGVIVTNEVGFYHGIFSPPTVDLTCSSKFSTTDYLIYYPKIYVFYKKEQDNI